MNTSRRDEVEVLLKVAASGNLSAAASTFGLTPSAVSKLITRVETRLATKLFQRSSRQALVTPEGRTYLDRIQIIYADLQAADDELRSSAGCAHGHLRVASAGSFITHQLVPKLPRFAQQHPDVILELISSDYLSRISEDRIDVAIRIGSIRQDTLRARKLSQSRMIVVASPKYLDTEGLPKYPDDLHAHRCLGFSFLESLNEWPFKRSDTETLYIRPRASHVANTGELVRELALAGMGIARLASFHVGADVEQGRLVSILNEFNPGDAQELNAIYPSQRFMPLRTRKFIDFLVKELPQEI